MRPSERGKKVIPLRCLDCGAEQHWYVPCADAATKKELAAEIGKLQCFRLRNQVRCKGRLERPTRPGLAKGAA